MKGIVLNLLEEALTAEHGEDVWDELLEAAGVEGAYTSLGSYPDAELTRLVEAASERLGIPPDDVVRWFGRKALPLLAERYPEFFEPHASTRSFLLTLNEIIHPEVRKLYPGADVPVFEYDFMGGDLLMSYRSARRLCAFGEGLIEGAIEYYGDPLSVEQTLCLKRGDDRCVFRVRDEAP